VKNILITGATGNLGTVVVEFFAARGYTVFALVSAGKTPRENQSANVTFWETDLTVEDSTAHVVGKIVKHHGHLDAAFLLAGGFAMGDLQASPLEAVHKMIAINFDTAYTVARAVHQHMNTQEAGGKLVFVGAKPAFETGSGSAMIGYTLSKSMLFKLADMLNADSAKSKVYCSVIVPGTIDTLTNRQAMPKADFSAWVKPETIAQELEKIILANNGADSQRIVKLF
jgi:NAD(P)-dependent dehydrogenase (short-subunit alcohol dehydrogenase family)